MGEPFIRYHQKYAITIMTPIHIFTSTIMISGSRYSQIYAPLYYGLDLQAAALSSILVVSFAAYWIERRGLSRGCPELQSGLGSGLCDCLGRKDVFLADSPTTGPLAPHLCVCAHCDVIADVVGNYGVCYDMRCFAKL